MDTIDKIIFAVVGVCVAINVGALVRLIAIGYSLLA